MKKLLTSVTLIGLGVLITGYGAWGKDSGASDKKLADMYRIDQIEKTWHKAASRKNLKLTSTPARSRQRSARIRSFGRSMGNG